MPSNPVFVYPVPIVLGLSFPNLIDGVAEGSAESTLRGHSSDSSLTSSPGKGGSSIGGARSLAGLGINLGIPFRAGDDEGRVLAVCGLLIASASLAETERLAVIRAMEILDRPRSEDLAGDAGELEVEAENADMWELDLECVDVVVDEREGEPWIEDRGEAESERATEGPYCVEDDDRTLDDLVLLSL
ncbi:hypothetical protein LTR60_003121 [Cryomyces antarcticus]|nr:hypothetical protein LTR60_003121 [Cryomyces antarcticus]